MAGFILAAIAAAGFLFWRMRAATEAGREIVGLADDARAALRRFGYNRKANQNPLDSVDDPRLAAAGIMACFARMDGDYTRDQISAIAAECAATFRAQGDEARDMAAYGRWLAEQAGTPEEGARRLTKRLQGKLEGHEIDQFFGMVERVAAEEGGDLSERQQLAMEKLRRAFAS